MAPVRPWDLYINEVLAGSIPANELIHRACRRHVEDLDTAADRGFYFDAAAAQRAIDFFGFLRHSKGEYAGKAFVLEPWQAFIIAMLFGWKRSADGTRRFRKAYIAVPRKNGKSTLVAGLGLLLLIADNEPGAEIYTIAKDRDQASLIFDESIRMRDSSPAIRKRVGFVGVPAGRSGKKNLHVVATNSKYEPRTADDESQHGLNAHAGLADEIHVHPSRDLWDVIESSMGSRRQPLMLGITTSGHDRQSFCFVLHDLSEKILTGVQHDDTMFCFIAMLEGNPMQEVSPGIARWEDEREWARANPNWGKSIKIDQMREAARNAKNDPTALNSFLRLRLNVWTSSEERAVLPHKWAACAHAEIDGQPCGDPVELRKHRLEELRGKSCFSGLDLASTIDLAADVFYFPKQPGVPVGRLIPFFFVPQDCIEERCHRDRVPYDVWIRQGFLISTPTHAIDYEFIRQNHLRMAKEYDLIETRYDPYNSSQLVTQLLEDGLTMVEHRQGDVSMNAPSKEFVRLIACAELGHDNNPILTWCVDNLMLTTGATGLIKPDKSKSREKIDGAVAAIMAIGGSVAHGEITGSENSVFFV
jgi:phage terminase large subunit-like protein